MNERKDYKLYAVNYANERFADAQHINTASALKAGRVDKVFEYNPEQIKELRDAYPHIFAYKRGGGLWLWKPYVVLKALEQIDDGDWLFYSDSGAMYVDDIHRLVEHAIADGEECMLFQLTWALASQYTKGETLKLMGCDNPRHIQILATFHLWKKTAANVAIVKEWFDACCDERLLSYRRFTDIPDEPDFIVHRDDQSLLDIVAWRHGIRAYRDPSDWGLRSYFWKPLMKGERSSRYPVMMISFRRADPVLYYREYRRRHRLWQLCLSHFGIYRRVFALLKWLRLWRPLVGITGI